MFEWFFFFFVGFFAGVVVRSVWNVEGADDYEDPENPDDNRLCDVDD